MRISVLVVLSRAVGDEFPLVVEIRGVLGVIKRVRRAFEPGDKSQPAFGVGWRVAHAKIHYVVVVEITDWQSPVIVDVVREVVFELRKIYYADVKLLDLELARTEGLVGALKFVLQNDLELSDARFNRCLLVRHVGGVDAALRLPPITFLGCLRGAVMLYPGFPGRQSVFHGQLTTRGNRTDHPVHDPRRPTPRVFVALRAAKVELVRAQVNLN